MNQRTILVWFRNDLRLSDNEMLHAAHHKGSIIVPVYIYDTRLFGESCYGTLKTGVFRAKFINESVEDLQRSIRANGGELIVLKGLPEELLPELARQYEADEVYHHREVAFEETKASSLVEEALWKYRLNLRHFIGHTLYHKEDLPFPIKDIPDEFNVFKKKTSRESVIRPCLEMPAKLNFHDEVPVHDIPSLSDLGFSDEEIAKTEGSEFRGGESEAEKRLRVLFNGKLADDGESGLSPWISLGCLSVHAYYHALNMQTYYPKKIIAKLMDELWWHDYYRFMFKKHGNKFFKATGFSSDKREFAEDQVVFENWKDGRTSDAGVNRIMQTLNTTGYITEPMRYEAASFLVNTLNFSWLHGAAYFEEKLIDYNPAGVYGSWAHIAGVGSSTKHNLKVLS